MPAHVGGDDIADRQQIGAAVMIDDALRIAGGARGVVQRNGVPFVERGAAPILVVALGEQRLVVELAQGLAGSGIFGVVIVDEQRARLGEGERLARQRRIFAIDDQRARFAMIEHEGERGGVEPGVQRVEHRAAHRHAVMGFQHRGRVGEQRRDGVAARKAAARERAGEPARARVEVAIIAPQRSVRDRQMVGEHRRRPLQESQRGQRLEIGGIAIKVAIVGRDGHGGARRLEGAHAS